MKELFDNKQEQILFCNSGKAYVHYNEKEVRVIESVQVGEDSYEDREVTKWEYDVIKIPYVARTEESVLATLKEEVIRQIEEYDDSKAVNNCYVVYGDQTMPYWADKFERDSLKGTIADFIALGREYYRLDLRDVNVSITVECVKLQAMMRVLETYAADCYNKTTDHIFAVRGLSNIEDVLNYDYASDYPNMPTFEF